MHSFIRNAAVLSVLVGVAAAGCSSSDDSASGGSGNGGSAGATGGTSNGGKGGSSNGGTAAGGTPSAGTGGSSSANGGKSGAGTAGTDSAAGAGDSAAGAGDSAAGAGGTASETPQECNALAFSGTLLNLTHYAASAVPTLSNGTLQAGDYRLTSGGLYDGGTGTFQFGSVVHVSIVDSTATLSQADTGMHSSTLVIEMGQPSSSPPTSVKLTCDTDPTLKDYVGVEASSGIKYGVEGNTFTLYEIPLKLLLVYTLQT